MKKLIFPLVILFASCSQPEPPISPKKEYLFLDLEIASIEHELDLLETDIRYADTGIEYTRANMNGSYPIEVWTNFTAGNVHHAEGVRKRLVTQMAEIRQAMKNPNIEVVVD